LLTFSISILVIGARNSGKTAFLNFLRKSLALPPGKRPTRSPEELEDLPQTSSVTNNFTCHYLETEIDHERIGLTLWDSEGLEKNMVDLQLREITTFLESKFEDTFAEEMKVNRAPGVRDTHIHCVFLVLDPARLDANIAASKKAAAEGPKSAASRRFLGALDEELDLQPLRTMLGKTTVVPIISKADAITTAHMAYLKKMVWDGLKTANIDPLEVLSLEGQDDESSTGSVDKFDERDEDEMNNQATAEVKPAGDEQTTTGRRTPDSETVPGTTSHADSPAPVASPRKVSGHTKRLSLSSLSTGDGSSETPLIPLSVLSPDPHTLENKNEPVGRRFPWGFADPYNPEHCDFLKLKDSVFGEWRSELREASRELWYERWRTSRLNYGNGKTSGTRNGVSSRSGRATR
jgi:septin family protein